jgi:hypothetical protein
MDSFLSGCMPALEGVDVTNANETLVAVFSGQAQQLIIELCQQHGVGEVDLVKTALLLLAAHSKHGPVDILTSLTDALQRLESLTSKLCLSNVMIARQLQKRESGAIKVLESLPSVLTGGASVGRKGDSDAN